LIFLGASQVLSVARTIQQRADKLGVGRVRTNSNPNWYDSLITEQALVRATQKLFSDGHYGMAVEEAYKCLNNMVKKRSGLSADGASLMNSAFSAKSPILKLGNLTSQSDRDQQEGYMQIFAGCMTGIRNPRAHEHSYDDQPETALEMLVWANHLMRLVRYSKRVAKPRKRNTV